MVFRSNADTKSMEIGILRAENHIPRILTYKNGILYSVDVIPKPFTGFQISAG
jgi:hypothetical protein